MAEYRAGLAASVRCFYCALVRSRCLLCCEQNNIHAHTLISGSLIFIVYLALCTLTLTRWRKSNSIRELPVYNTHYIFITCRLVPFLFIINWKQTCSWYILHILLRCACADEYICLLVCRRIVCLHSQVSKFERLMLDILMRASALSGKVVYAIACRDFTWPALCTLICTFLVSYMLIWTKYAQLRSL